MHILAAVDQYSSAYHAGAILGRLVPLLLLALAIVMFVRERRGARGGRMSRTGFALGVFAALIAWNVLVVVHPFGKRHDNRTVVNMRAGFADGCAARSPRSYCDCVAAQLTGREGIDTTDEMRQLGDQLRAAVLHHDPAAVPVAYRNAVRDCRSSA